MGAAERRGSSTQGHGVGAALRDTAAAIGGGLKDGEHAVEAAVEAAQQAVDSQPFHLAANKSRAQHSLISFFLGMKTGNLLLLTMTSLSLVLIGALAWLVVGCGDKSCEEYPEEFWAAWWLSWGLHFDPGTQTGIDAREKPLQKWHVVTFSVLGFVLNLIFLSTIVDHVRILLDTLRRRHGRVIANDHTVILGWTDKTLFLLGELAEMMTDSQAGGGTIVVLGELDVLEMRMEVKVAFPNWRKKWRRVKVQYYMGKPYEVDDLLKVAVYAAERIIVLGCSRQPRVADSQMLTTICALRCLPDGRYITQNTNIIAELQIQQNEPVVEHISSAAAEGAEPDGDPDEDDEDESGRGGLLARCFGWSAGSGGDGTGAQHPLSLTPVVGNHATNALMSLCALDSSAGKALLDLMDFRGDQLETIECAPFTKRTESNRTTFATLRNAFNSATPLGIKQGGQVYLAPHDSHPITPDTQLLVIAADIAAAMESSKLAARDSRQVAASRDKSKVSTLHAYASRRHMKEKFTASHMISRVREGIRRKNTARVMGDPAASGDTATPTPASAKLLEAISDRPLPPMPRTILFIGWQSGFETLLELLDARLPAGSKVYILSKKLEHHRREELQAVGLELNGAVHIKEGKHTTTEGETAAGPAANDEQADAGGLRNCELIHEIGYTTDEKAIRRLPLATADAAVIVADADKQPGDEVEALGGAELQIADSEALTSTILLRRLHLDCNSTKPFTVVTEFVDLLTRRLLERQPDLISRTPATSAGEGSSSANLSNLAPSTPRKRMPAPNGNDEVLSVETSEGGPATPRVADTSAGGPPTKSVVFHRNHIETTALSLAAHSSTSWGTVQMLLDPYSGCKIYSLLVQDAGIPLCTQAATPHTPATDRRFRRSVAARKLDDGVDDGANSGTSPSTARQPVDLEVHEFSFADLSDYLTSRQFGLLIGWKRKRDKDVIINPPRKDKPIRWFIGDELILLKGQEQE